MNLTWGEVQHKIWAQSDQSFLRLFKQTNTFPYINYFIFVFYDFFKYFIFLLFAKKMVKQKQ